MEPRLNYREASPETQQALVALETAVRKSSIEAKLRELVYLRVSQINGCAYCVELHAHDLRRAGETDPRIDSVVVWHEAPFFTPRERAAFAWAEALTTLGPNAVPDAVLEQVQAHFDERALVELTLLVSTINVWNRFGVAFRLQPPVRDAKPL